MQLFKKNFLFLFLMLMGSMLMAQETYLDNFNTTPESYSENNGTQNFATSWVESGDDGNPASGRIEIVSSQLEFNNIDSRSISRTLDLSAATSATLTPGVHSTARRIGIGVGCSVTIEA